MRSMTIAGPTMRAISPKQRPGRAKGATMDTSNELPQGAELPAMEHLGKGETGQQDRMNMVDNLATIGFNPHVWLLLHGSALTLWNAFEALSRDTEGDGDEPINRLGHVLMLDALIAAPEATQAMLRCLRREL